MYGTEDAWPCGGVVPCVLNLGTGWKWVASLIYLGEIVSGTNALGWVEPRAGVGGVEKRQNPCTRLESKPGSSSPEPNGCTE